ncbi:hydrogen peroxide-inducible genes activator [Jiulongibacter sp. NS-SX5]|uniref:hydrogen peroxide-inducible genes activator n=1 Tax=Jiulongibacter sp. NS-SX5 TaxID=3463854 RepID=UPI004058DBDA
MTINQIQYVIAVAKHKNFSKAAEECHVSQPALSMQIKQLEDELGEKLIDRSKSPLKLTALGEKVLNQASKAYAEFIKIKSLTEVEKEPTGELRLAIIPTLAPYVLPLFVKEYTSRFPKVQLSVKELTTQEIIEEISERKLDAAILATPLKNPEIVETPLFYERMLAYVSPSSALSSKKYAITSEIDPEELWLLEEGHCLRSQVEQLCQLQKKATPLSNFSFKAGSIDTLLKLVDHYQGITVIPELATLYMNEEEKAKLRPFAKPTPTREISLIHHQFALKSAKLLSLENCLKENIPDFLFEKDGKVLEV